MMNKYFKYLMSIVGDYGSNYKNLMMVLHQIEFYSLVPNDDNREADGENFRGMFIEKFGSDDDKDLPNISCTIFELLIGLAKRLEFEMVGGPEEKPIGYWFYILLTNLKLQRFSDDTWKTGDDYYRNNLDSRRQIQKIVKIMLEHKYDRKGNGGLFPLKVAHEDQRRIEIWYQMSAWLEENFKF